MRILLFVFLVQICIFPLQSQTPAEGLLAKSIAYHDPDDRWSKWKAELNFTVLFPGKPDATRYATIDNESSAFVFRADYEEGTLIYKVEQGIGSALWNSSDVIPEEFAKQYRISKERALMYSNYYGYLYGMPMKLKDPGTHIGPTVELVEFYGKEYNKIRVTYDKEVGTDTWYFYFNPKSNALEAYQFFKDESKNDGEYILFEGEIVKDGIKIPKDRKWYYNTDGKYLATDVLD